MTSLCVKEYITIIENTTQRKALTQMRIRSHPQNIETHAKSHNIGPTQKNMSNVQPTINYWKMRNIVSLNTLNKKMQRIGSMHK